MSYVDIFVAAVPSDRKDAFAAFSETAHQVLKDAGATSIMDAWDDDVPKGELTCFRSAVKATDDEKIAGGWIIWPDKETRDAGLQKMMADPRMDAEKNPAPFDGSRMIFGGFTPLVETP